MSLLTSARMLTRYNSWANKLFFEAVAALPPGESAKERATLFKSIVHTLNHNYVIDRIFQAHLEGREHGYAARNTPASPPLGELWAAQKALDEWYIEWGERMSEETLGEPIRFTFVGGGEGVMTRYEILTHLVNHTSYHRGFAADMFYQIPARPPTTDLPVYLRDARSLA